MRIKIVYAGILLFIFLLVGTHVYALTETPDATPTTGGFDISDLIVISTSVLALILGVVSAIAYARDGRSKFLFVTLAFFIFTIKGVLIIGSDVLALPQPVFDNVAHLLDFAILLCFFIGMIKRSD